MSHCHIFNQISIDQSIFSSVIPATKKMILIRSEFYLLWWQSCIWEKQTNGKTIFFRSIKLSAKINQWKKFPPVTNPALLEKYSFRRNVPDEEVYGLKKIYFFCNKILRFNCQTRDHYELKQISEKNWKSALDFGNLKSQICRFIDIRCCHTPPQQTYWT